MQPIIEYFEAVSAAQWLLVIASCLAPAIGLMIKTGYQKRLSEEGPLRRREGERLEPAKKYPAKKPPVMEAKVTDVTPTSRPPPEPKVTYDIATDQGRIELPGGEVLVFDASNENEAFAARAAFKQANDRLRAGLRPLTFGAPHEYGARTAREIRQHEFEKQRNMQLNFNNRLMANALGDIASSSVFGKLQSK